MENEVKAIEKVEKTGFMQKAKPVMKTVGQNMLVGAAATVGGMLITFAVNKTVEAIQNYKAKKAIEGCSEPKKKKGLFGKKKVEKTGQIKEKDEVMENLDDLEERIN